MKNDNFLRSLFRPLEYFLIIDLIIIFVVVLLEVACRYVFHQSLAWNSEVAQTLLVWLAFIGSVVALAGNEHMQITILMGRIHSPAVKKFLNLVGDLGVLFFLACGGIGGIKLVQRTWKLKTTTLQIPAGVLYMAFPIACALMILVVLHHIVCLFRSEE